MRVGSIPRVKGWIVALEGKNKVRGDRLWQAFKRRAGECDNKINVLWQPWSDVHDDKGKEDGAKGSDKSPVWPLRNTKMARMLSRNEVRGSISKCLLLADLAMDSKVGKRVPQLHRADFKNQEYIS